MARRLAVSSGMQTRAPASEASPSPQTSAGADLATALRRGLSPRAPDRVAVGGFVGGEILSGIAGWSAGLAGSWLVGQFFVARGIRNLWGLAARGDRTVVSHQTYEWLGTIAEYVVGLGILLLVQHVVGGTLREYAALRRSEAPAPADAQPGQPAPGGSAQPSPAAPGGAAELGSPGPSGPEIEPDDR